MSTLNIKDKGSDAQGVQYILTRLSRHTLQTDLHVSFMLKHAFGIGI